MLRLLCRDRPEGVDFKARIPNSRNMVVLREVIGAGSGKQLCHDVSVFEMALYKNNGRLYKRSIGYHSVYNGLVTPCLYSV